MSYDAALAREFFQSAGEATEVPAGKTLFAEKEAPSALFFRKAKIYLLLDGEVGLLAGGKPFATVRPGQIFGEIAAITHGPRSASAVTRTACRLIALDDEQLERGLARTPAFALMLMSMLIERLRATIAQLRKTGGLDQDTEVQDSAAFDPDQIPDLVRGLADDPPIYYPRGRQIVAEGQTATLMYAVVSGRVAISIGGRVVERLGPGGAFGEAALMAQTGRLATAVAETDCELQPITRKAFLALVKISPDFAHRILASLAARLGYLTERLKR